MSWGAGLFAGGEAEQYERSSRYPINAVIARHESNVSTEAESHVVLCLLLMSVSKSHFSVVGLLLSVLHQ